MRPERTDALLPGHGDSAPASSTTSGNHHEADDANGIRRSGQRGVTRPEFIRVLPAEVERYGSQGAVLMAHIRFRTAVDGVSWWRASHDDIAQETGLSVKGVKTGLSRLGDAVVAVHFKPLSDRRLSYRVATHQNGADLPLAENGEWADLPLSENGQSLAENGQSISPNRLIQKPKTADVLLTGEAKKGENASADEEPIDQSRNESPEPTPPNGIDPPERTCPKHPYGTDDKCPPCGAARRSYEAWKKRGPQQLSALQREVTALESQEERSENNEERMELSKQIRELRSLRRNWIAALRAEGVEGV